MPRSRKVRFGLDWAVFGNFKWGQELSNRYRRLTQNPHTYGTILLDIDLDGKHLYLSDKYITAETVWHEGLVSDWGSSGLAGGASGISELSDITITLLNGKLSYQTDEFRVSEILDNYMLEGRTATFRQYFDGITYAECAIFHTGKIDSISFDDSFVYLTIIDDEDVFKEIPISRVSKQEFADCPPASIGLGKPVIYGKADERNNYNRKNWMLFPTVLVDKSTNKLILADHLVAQDTFPEATPDGQMYMYHDGLNNYLRAYNIPNASYSNAATGAILTMNHSISLELCHRPTIKGSQYDCANTDYSNAIDQDLTTTFEIASEENFYLQIGTLPDLGLINRLYLQVRVILDSATGSSPYGTIKYYNPAYDANVGGFSTGTGITDADVAAEYDIYAMGSDYAAHGEAAGQEDNLNAWNWNELSKYEIGITANTDCTIVIKDIFLWVIAINIDTNVINKRFIATRRQPSRGI